jgi:hypothetical protein
VVSVKPRPLFTFGERTPDTHWIGEAEWASELVWTQRLQKKYFASASDRRDRKIYS